MPSGRQPRIGDDTIDRFFVLAHALDGPPLAAREHRIRNGRPTGARAHTGRPRRGAASSSLPPCRRTTRATSHRPASASRATHDAALVFAHGPQHRHLFSHGHLHADAGSFELELEGVPVVVDAGTYVYFARHRTRAPTSRAHAPTTRRCVDDVEPMQSLEPFRWENVAAGEYLGFGATSATGGDCAGFSGADGVPIEHTRAFVLRTAPHGARLRSQARRVPVRRIRTSCACVSHADAAGNRSCDGPRARYRPASFRARDRSVRNGHARRRDRRPDDRNCWYSSRYGELQRGVAVRVSAELESRVVVSDIRSIETP